MKRRQSVRSKIVIDNKIIEQVNCFNCSGNLIYYENEVDINDNKLDNYLKIAFTFSYLRPVSVSCCFSFNRQSPTTTVKVQRRTIDRLATTRLTDDTGAAGASCYYS